MIQQQTRDAAAAAPVEQGKPFAEIEAEAPDFADVHWRARNSLRQLRGESLLPHPTEEVGRRTTMDRGLQPAAFTSSLLQRFTGRAGAPVPLETPPVMYERIRSHSGEVRIGWYVPERFTEATYGSFQPQNAAQRAALAAVRAWADAAKRGEGPLLALTGAVGTGKSHLLYAAVRSLNLGGVHAGAWTWQELSTALRRRYDGIREVDTTLHRFGACSALAIDEIRHTSGTAFDYDQLSGILTDAYNDRRAVVLTSNHAGEQLAALVGRAAYDRLREVQLVGESYRQLRAL